MVECGMKCVKLLLIVFNLIFVIAGIGLIAAGATVQIKFKDYFALIDGQFSSAAALLIAVGVIIFFIAAFGCCGAWKENYICIMIMAFQCTVNSVLRDHCCERPHFMISGRRFAVLLGIIFVLEIAGGIAGYVYHNKVEETVKDLMQKTQKSHQDGDVWDTVQKEFKCCGVTNYTEWETLLNGTVPKSCCQKDKPGCTGAAQDIPSEIYTEPCLTKFGTFVKDNILIIGGVGIGLAFVQILGILFACCLARALKKEYEVV